jgi:hypothetical protein
MDESRETQLTVVHYLERLIEALTKLRVMLPKHLVTMTYVSANGHVGNILVITGKIVNEITGTIIWIKSWRDPDNIAVMLPHLENMILRDLQNRMVWIFDKMWKLMGVVIGETSKAAATKNWVEANTATQIEDYWLITEIQNLLTEGANRFMQSNLSYVGSPIQLDNVMLSKVSRSVAKCYNDGCNN